jgi:hypothetical protein
VRPRSRRRRPPRRSSPRTTSGAERSTRFPARLSGPRPLALSARRQLAELRLPRCPPSRVDGGGNRPSPGHASLSSGCPALPFLGSGCPARRFVCRAVSLSRAERWRADSPPPRSLPAPRRSDHASLLGSSPDQEPRPCPASSMPTFRFSRRSGPFTACTPGRTPRRHAAIVIRCLRSIIRIAPTRRRVRLPTCVRRRPRQPPRARRLRPAPRRPPHPSREPRRPRLAPRSRQPPPSRPRRAPVRRGQPRDPRQRRPARSVPAHPSDRGSSADSVPALLRGETTLQLFRPTAPRPSPRVFSSLIGVAA